MLELKRSTISIGDGIRQSIVNQRREFIESFFSTVQFVFAGNDTEGLRYGTIKTQEKFFLKWKEDVEDNSRLQLDKYLLKICNKKRLIEIINDFVLFDGGMILGSRPFIKDILKKIKSEYLNKEDVSFRRELKYQYGAKEIVDIVSGYFKSSNEWTVWRKMTEMKKISLYLMKKHTGMTNREIEELFRGYSTSAAAKQIQRFVEDLKTNKKLKKIIDDIEPELSIVKG